MSGASRTIIHDAGFVESEPLQPEEIDQIEAEIKAEIEIEVEVEVEVRAKTRADDPPSGSALGAGGVGGAGGAAARPAWLEGAALVHLDGRHAKTALHAARCARACGVAVLLDVER